MFEFWQAEFGQHLNIDFWTLVSPREERGIFVWGCQVVTLIYLSRQAQDVLLAILNAF